MNNFIINWVSTNWISLLIVVFIILFVVFLLVNKKKKMLAEVLLELMVEAERYLQSVPGELRKNEVILALLDSLPAWMHLFIKKKTIDNLIEKIFKESKELLNKIKQQAIEEVDIVIKT